MVTMIVDADDHLVTTRREEHKMDTAPEPYNFWKQIKDDLHLLWYSLSVFIIAQTMPVSIRIACYKGEVEMLAQFYPVTIADQELLQKNYRINLKPKEKTNGQ